MTGYAGELKYTLIEPFFVDATDEDDAKEKAKEALLEDFPEAVDVIVFSISEVKKR